MNFTFAPLILGFTLSGCTGETGPSGAAANADDVATALATNAAIEAAIEKRVAEEVEAFVVESRDFLRGDDGPQGEQGQPGEMGTQGERGIQGEVGLPGQNATRWKVCGVSVPKTADRAGFTYCSGEDQCTNARICTVDELIAGSITHLGNLTATGAPQTNYLRQVGEQLIADEVIDAENPYAFAHSGFWSSSCENYSQDGASTREAFSDELVELNATVWPLIQLSVRQIGEDNSSTNAVSARLAPCNITAPVICCDADGRPEVLPPQQ